MRLENRRGHTVDPLEPLGTIDRVTAGPRRDEFIDEPLAVGQIGQAVGKTDRAPQIGPGAGAPCSPHAASWPLIRP